ncbi:unnamed protein product [Arabis nemorensis]|uniref:Uncharacterized protein n=1 Tax=Arabis nemorensis TaxID=586526 RepID=A0A565B0J7_9BRAS|nr:unnamed protein product [Arabis nemorensis]
MSMNGGDNVKRYQEEVVSKSDLMKLRPSSCLLGGEDEDYQGEVELLIRMLKLHEEEVDFSIRVSNAGGFDIEHLMDSRPSSCLLSCYSNCTNLDDLRCWEVFLYARMGIHKYNMIQGTNLEISYIEKYNLLHNPQYHSYSITLAAKDPDAGGSLVPFQTRVVVRGREIKKMSCPVARIKPGPQENHSLQSTPPLMVDDFYKGTLPVWPSSDDVFADENRLSSQS